MPPTEDQGAIEQRVARIETSVELLADSMNKLARQVTRIAEHQAELGRTNWSVVIAGLALTAAVMMPIITGLTYMIYRVDNQAVKVDDRLSRHVEDDRCAVATAAQLERLKALEREAWGEGKPGG